MSKRKSNKRYTSPIDELKQQLINTRHWESKWRDRYYRLKAETVSKKEYSDIQKKFVMSNNLAMALRRKLDKCEQLCERISTQFSISADQDTINKLEAELKELSEFRRSALDTMAVDRQTIAELRDQIKDYTIDFSEKDQPVPESVNESVDVIEEELYFFKKFFSVPSDNADVTVAEEKLKLFEKMFDAATDNTYLLSDQVSQFKEILCETTDNVISLNKANGELRRENNELKSELVELREYKSSHPESRTGIPDVDMDIVENTEMIELREHVERLKKEALINIQQYDQILEDKKTEYRDKIKNSHDTLQTYIAAADELRKELSVNKNDLSKCRELCETLTKENHDRQKEYERLRVTNKKLVRDNDLWIRQQCDILSVSHNGVIEALRMIESQPELVFCNPSFVSNITTHMNLLRNNIEKCISLPADIGFGEGVAEILAESEADRVEHTKVKAWACGLDMDTLVNEIWSLRKKLKVSSEKVSDNDTVVSLKNKINKLENELRVAGDEIQAHDKRCDEMCKDLHRGRQEAESKYKLFQTYHNVTVGSFGTLIDELCAKLPDAEVQAKKQKINQLKKKGTTDMNTDDDDGRECAFGLSNEEIMKKEGRVRTEMLNDKINSMSRSTHELVQENQMLKEQLNAIDSLSTTDIYFYAEYAAIKEQYDSIDMWMSNIYDANQRDLERQLDESKKINTELFQRGNDLKANLMKSTATNKELVEKNRQLSREVAEQKDQLKEASAYIRTIEKRADGIYTAYTRTKKQMNHCTKLLHSVISATQNSESVVDHSNDFDGDTAAPEGFEWGATRSSFGFNRNPEINIDPSRIPPFTKHTLKDDKVVSSEHFPNRSYNREKATSLGTDDVVVLKGHLAHHRDLAEKRKIYIDKLKERLSNKEQFCKRKMDEVAEITHIKNELINAITSIRKTSTNYPSPMEALTHIKRLCDFALSMYRSNSTQFDGSDGDSVLTTDDLASVNTVHYGEKTDVDDATEWMTNLQKISHKLWTSGDIAREGTDERCAKQSIDSDNTDNDEEEC